MIRLTTDLLWEAYLMGAFPMGSDDADEIQFYGVEHRCLFPIEGIRVSQSLRKTLRNPNWKVTFDTAFDECLWNCRRPVGNNWITPEIARVYGQAHREGWAHSCEVWWEGKMVGGTYGLALGTCFSAESMFHRRTDASKVALYHMVEKCRSLGFTHFDAEVTNPHLESLGSYTMPIKSFLRELRRGLATPTLWSIRR